MTTIHMFDGPGAEDGPGRSDSPDVLAAMEVDYTPTAVAVQCLLALKRELYGIMPGYPLRQPPRLILDPSAGSGVWGRAARAVFPEAFTVGVEPRASERGNLRRAYDCDISDTLDGYLSAAVKDGARATIDLVATNPPFSVAFGAETFWPLQLRDRMAHGGLVALLGRSDWGQSQDAAASLRAWCPTLQLRIGGRVAYRGGPAADAREHSLWVWLNDGLRPGGLPRWTTIQLPALPPALRQWDPSQVPGTYAVDAELVEAVRRSM